MKAIEASFVGCGATGDLPARHAGINRTDVARRPGAFQRLRRIAGAASALALPLVNRRSSLMVADPARFVLTLSCGDRRGIVAAVANSHRLAGLQHRRERPVRRPGDRALLHAGVVLGSGKDDGGVLLARVPSGRDRVRFRLASSRSRRETARPDSRFQIRALPERSSLPPFHRPPADGSRGGRLQPRHDAPARRGGEPPLRPSSGHARNQAGAGEGAGRDGRARRRSISSCSRATCRCCRRTSARGSSAGSSTSITRSCRASSARGPIIARTSAA